MKNFRNITERDEVKDFLVQPLLARMATCNPKTLQPHVVPVWFGWDGESVWIHTFWSTRKVRELQANPRISVTIDTDGGGKPVRGVIFEGQAELIRDPTVIVPRANSIYVRYLGEAGAQEAEPQSWIHDAESALIKVTPDSVHAWGLGG